MQTAHTPNWVKVAALTPAEEVVMMLQYRHGAEDIYLDLPGRLVDGRDESAKPAAQQELLEETGFASIFLKRIYFFKLITTYFVTH